MTWSTFMLPIVALRAKSDDPTISDGPSVNDDTLSRHMACVPQPQHVSTLQKRVIELCRRESHTEEEEVYSKNLLLLPIGVASLTDRKGQGGADHLEQRSRVGVGRWEGEEGEGGTRSLIIGKKNKASVEPSLIDCDQKRENLEQFQNFYTISVFILRT